MRSRLPVVAFGCLLLVTTARRAGAAAAPAVNPICSADGWCWDYPELPPYGPIAIAGTGPSDVWLSYTDGVTAKPGANSTTIVHWDGSRFAVALRSKRYIQSLWAVGVRDVWATADDGTFLHWDGASWRERSGPPANSLGGVRATPGDGAWAVGSNGLTHCDATSCAIVATGLRAVRSVWPATKELVWLVSGGLWRWDGRRAERVEGVPEDAIEVGGSGPQDGWLVTRAGAVWRWNGSTWSVLYRERTADEAEEISAASGPGASALWAVDRHNRAIFFDGRRWARSPGGEGDNYTSDAIWASSATDVWVSSGPLLRFDGRAWTQLPPRDPRGINMVFAVGPEEIWAVGEKGLVLRREAGRWRPVPSPAPEDLRAVFGSAGDDVWVTGDSIWHWDGRTWSRSLANERCNALWGIGRSDVWAVGKKVLHWNGKAWTTIFDMTGNETASCSVCPVVLNAAWGFSPEEVVGAGAHRDLTGKDMGPPGARWGWGTMKGMTTEQLKSELLLSSGSNEEYRAIWGTSLQDVWLGGDGPLEHGSWWSMRKITKPRLSGVASIWGRGPRDVWVVSTPENDDARVWRYDGKRWSIALTLLRRARPTSVTGTKQRVWVAVSVEQSDGKRLTSVILSRDRARR